MLTQIKAGKINMVKVCFRNDDNNNDDDSYLLGVHVLFI